MADPVHGAVVGFVVGKILTKVIEAASLAYHHDKYCTDLANLLKRLQPVAAQVSEKMDAGDTAARSWVQSLHDELQKADEILQNRREEWRVTNSKKIVSVMRSIKKLVNEAGLLGVAVAAAGGKEVEVLRVETREYHETERAQIASLEQKVEAIGHGLAEVTRNAVFTPVCNYGHSVGITSPQAAFSEIKRRADFAMGAAAAGSTSGASTSEARAGAGAAGEPNRILRRQTTETRFGGDELVEDLLSILLSQDASKRRVGVWATGGAGKTFTAERLFNSPALESHFTGGIFWLTVGRDASVSKLLQSLSTQFFHGPLPGVFTSDEDLKNRVCQKLGKRERTLLFLDDVWRGSDLDWLDVLPAGGLNRIFVTTRIKDVLEGNHTEMIQVPMLPEEDSWKLFCWYAFGGSDKVPADLEDVAKQVADECKGLPLALKVIGSALYGKKERVQWSWSLKKLKDAEVLSPTHEEQLFLRLKLSVDELRNLDPHLTDCFLYFAAFPEGASLRMMEDLLDAWVGEGIVQSGGKDPYGHAFELLGWLIARSLIELQSPKTKSYLRQVFMTCRIHDVLRDLARYVVQHKQEPHERDCLYESGRSLEVFPQEWIDSNKRGQLSARRVSLSFNSLTALPEQLKAPKLEVLLLRDNPLTELPSAFFESFRGLKVLDLRNTDIKKLPHKLGHNLKQLVVLNLSACRDLETIPDSTGEMKRLQRLDLSRCYKLSSLPSSLSKLTSLQILNLCMSINVWDDKGPSGVGCTHVSGIPFSKTRAALKDVGRLTALNQLWISSSKARKFPLGVNSLKKLQSLDVWFESVESLPEMGELKTLETLTLQFCKSLVSLPTSIEVLAALITLDLTSCTALSTLPALDQLPRLRVLNLIDCSNLETLPPSFARAGSFPALKELRLRNCRRITDFPALEAGAMPQLVLLSLAGWLQLTTGLPQPLQQLNKLRTLDVSHCTSLQSLDGLLDLGTLSSLEELDVRLASALSSLPVSLASLPNLKKLDISLCLRALHIPPELLQLEAERRLQIVRTS